MGLFDDFIDMLMGLKVQDDLQKEELDEDEELEAMIFLDQQIKKENDEK